MANTIKHKRGSGSDPSASDLAVGELAIRTDTGVVFTKKDDGTVAEISGGGGTVADDVIYENSQTISNDYTITTNKNAMSAGPISISSSATVTVPSGSTWHIL
tara:strand:- start:191 stop:499 length:309 start_codon:yes stop_codon:yes gene_type:complete